jgi:hypothetical protein
MVAIGDLADDANVAGAGDGEAPPQNTGTSAPWNPGPSAPPTSPTGGTDINAQLTQARELEARLAEEYCAVRLLHTSIAGEASARGEHMRELGKQAREHINADFNVDDPNTPPRASQKLIAALTLLRAMSHPQRPRQETCTARRRHSSSRRPYRRLKARRPAYASKAVRGTTAAPKAKRHPFTRAARRATSQPVQNAGQGADP